MKRVAVTGLAVLLLGAAGCLSSCAPVTEELAKSLVPSGSTAVEPTTAEPETQVPSTDAEQTTVPPINGFVDEDGVRRYYIDGVLQTSTVVGSEEEGYFYAGDDGVIDKGYCDGVTVNDTDWIIIEGSAYRVETDSDSCLFAAARDVAACTSSYMTREEKLRACFDYIKDHYLEGVRHNPPYPYTEYDWPVVYANDLFIYGKGDCYSYGAAYAYMARAIGYVESYACNSGGHGWAEVENRTYDPEWSMHSSNYSYFGMSYDEECDVNYSSAIENDIEEKRRQIFIN